MQPRPRGPEEDPGGSHLKNNSVEELEGFAALVARVLMGEGGASVLQIVHHTVWVISLEHRRGTNDFRRWNAQGFSFGEAAEVFRKKLSDEIAACRAVMDTHFP